MADREKVIKAYEDYVNSYIPVTTYGDYVFEMHKAVLALLKEQDAEIEQLKRFVNGFSRDAMPVVQCRDCKNHGTMDCPMCEEGNCIFHTADNWYCADGERKSD